jgi:solute carrier family 25 protein 34/35
MYILNISLFYEIIATSSACVFSNPLEVCKTRMQLQGELTSVDATKVKPYRNVFHAFYKILTTEGIVGLQRGLVPGMAYQASMNGIRLGLYAPVKNVIGAEPDKPFYFIKNMIAGASTGILGAIAGSPWFMIKCRIQAQSTAVNTVGTQHSYLGMIDGFKQVVKEEGYKGLFRGVEGAMARVAVGSAVQLSTYDTCKELVLKSGCVNDGVLTHLSASLLAGLAVTTAMNPFDVVSTRLYNQKVDASGRGLLYNGWVDCFSKTIKAEGFLGLYKGWSAHYFRLGPHTIATFVIWEQFKSMADKCGY